MHPSDFWGFSLTWYIWYIRTISQNNKIKRRFSISNFTPIWTKIIYFTKPCMQIIMNRKSEKLEGKKKWNKPCIIISFKASECHWKGSVVACKCVKELLRDVVLAEGVLEGKIELVGSQDRLVGCHLGQSLAVWNESKHKMQRAWKSMGRISWCFTKIILGGVSDCIKNGGLLIASYPLNVTNQIRILKIEIEFLKVFKELKNEMGWKFYWKWNKVKIRNSKFKIQT